MMRAISRLFKNTIFRLSLWSTALFAASSFVILGFIYYQTVQQDFYRIDEINELQLKKLAESYEEQGPRNLARLIAQGMNYDDSRYGVPGIVLLLYQVKPGEIITNISGLAPEVQQSEAGVTKFLYNVRAQDGESLIRHAARGVSGVFPDGSYLLIARDVQLIVETADRVKRASIVAMLLALFFGLLSGYFVSRKFAKRVDSFNRLATGVRAGDLNRRAPRDYSGDELDALAEHLNAMLDHISRLMDAMRYAGDSIAHDLRSPLTRLRTRLESAATTVKDEEAAEVLISASDDAEALLRTFESVLRIARLEAGERREMLSACDPKPLLDDIAELYEPACEDAGLTFSADIRAGLNIIADRGLLSQAVSNLVENAIKYTPEGGAIALNLMKNKDGRTVVSVLDSGPGIPEQERERVKERFVRLEESRSQKGSGLGLALVDAVAHLHRAQFVLGEGIAQEGRPGLSAAIIFPRGRKFKSADTSVS